MHKDDAAKLFGVLSDGSRVKICKMLYLKGSLDFDELLNLIGCDDIKLNEHLNLLIESELVIKEDKYLINSELLDTLMSFISTPCGCAK